MVTRQLFRLANGIVFVCLFGAAGIRAASSLDARSALAGGLAGGMTNGILHPIDTAKTLRQRNPKEFKTTFGALVKCYKTQGIRGLYGGFGPAVVGAIPSSALYFGAYECTKRRLKRAARETEKRFDKFSAKRVYPAIHMVSAAAGNAASSAVFVPKEFVKQQLQGARAAGSSLTAFECISLTIREKGVGALYSGYAATLLRNIPSAAIRFTTFEALKAHLGCNTTSAQGTWRMMAAGAASGLLASSLTTPMDVIKTRIASGALDRELGIVRNLGKVLAEEGVSGLFAGLQGRIVWSMLFSAVGFTTFEYLKAQLGVTDELEAEDEADASFRSPAKS
mmetsp:Transcript_5698/g.13216  ORF Transcript_5698/g.13216 Transcript_5698/m.13216 type:complete len:337 (-) Transcript_5698:345-1355(-)